MRKVLLVLGMVLLLSGCSKKIEFKDEKYEVYKTKIVEVIDNDYYIVSKEGYTIGGIYRLYTNNENYEVDDIVYVIVIDNYNCLTFIEYLDGK